MLTVILLLLIPVLAGPICRSTISQSPIVSASTPEQFILYVHDSGDSFDKDIFETTTRTLHYSRLKYDTLDLDKAQIWPRLDQYSAILFVAESLDKIGNLQAPHILEYVANGGGVAVTYRGWNPRLAPLFGYRAGTRAEFFEKYETETGVHFIADFFPGVKGLSLSREIVPGHALYNLPLSLESQTRVVATSDSGRPLAWMNQYGQGRTIFWNTDFLTTRDARGFVIQSVQSVQPVAVLPIANFATYQIDDFPAAVSTQKIEPIKTEYDMTMVDFYNTVWVPDMMEVSQRYNIPYTFFIPFNYNPYIEPEFDFKEWDHAKIEVDNQELTYSIYISHLVAQQHELGLHGYNHVSLLVAPNYWIPERDVGDWLYAQNLLDAWQIVTAYETLELLSAQEQARSLSAEERTEKEEATEVIAKAVETKITEIDSLVEADKIIEELTAKERQKIELTPKEVSVKNVAHQKIDKAGDAKLIEAYEIVSLPEEEIAAIAVGQAQTTVVDAGEQQISQAATTAAEMEQQAEDNMVLALATASQRWDEDNLGPQPVSYVPPNNIFHPAGTRALLRGFPTLKIMAGVYTGHFDTGGEREYGPEVWNADFFAIPRITAEYTLTPSSRFTMISMLSLMGVWTHFVHPDDVFHTPENYPLSSFHRNPNSLPWRGDHTGNKDGYYYHVIEWLDFNEENFPWLRYTYTNESFDILKTHLENHVTVRLSPDELELLGNDPSYYFVRVNNGQRIDLTALGGAQFLDVHQGEGYRLYTLRGVKKEVTLKLLPSENVDTLSLPRTQATLTISTQPENVLDFQSQDAWEVAPIPTSEPTSTPTPTATPAFDVLPIPTPTLRSRP